VTLVLGRPRTRWRLRDPSARENGIAGFPRIVATVLAARGVTTRAQADLFYKPHLASDYDPLLLPGMREALQRTRSAIADGELIALYGDFDVDGVTSVAVLHTGLRPLGARTTNYIPDRFAEGYGLNVDAVQRLARQGCGLLITADCGISSVPRSPSPTSWASTPSSSTTTPSRTRCQRPSLQLTPSAKTRPIP
jgi:single-stranded-DNA-specific exonuclease